MSKKYLYGASIQGIQDFIFKTNKLAEIVGASELVEQICTTKFLEISGFNKNEDAILQIAAGNVKCEFSDETKLAYVVRNFPLMVQKIAPGVTISQAVVLIEGEDYLQKLEDKLKIQRNKILKPFEIGFMGLERDRRSGGIAFKKYSKGNGKEEYLSEEADLKRKAIKSSEENRNEFSTEKLFEKISGIKNVPNSELSFDIENITDMGKNSWIAVIHADGNGLGNILQNRVEDLNTNKEFKDFSLSIESATKTAVQRAFNNVVVSDKKEFEVKNQNNKKYRYPIRPIVLGGDDLTVIIRADLALAFTETFLIEFEKSSKDEFSKLKTKGIDGLTACAGIAFIKESFPLHYGLNLAEELCKDAKKSSRIESSLTFYKVQESFIVDFDLLKEKTLKTKSGLSFYAGPYNLENLNELNRKLATIKKESVENDKTKAVGKLRQIVSETYKDKSTAIFMLKRMKEINEDFYKSLKLEKELEEIESNGKSQLVDLITLHGFNYGN